MITAYLEASTYAINIGMFEQKQNAEKVLQQLSVLDAVAVDKLVIISRDGHENNFLLRSQNYETRKSAQVQQVLIQQVVSDAFVVERKNYVPENKGVLKAEPKIIAPAPVVKAPLQVGMSSEDKEIYATAIKHFNAKEYQKSYDLLSQIFLTYLSDSRLNFYLGRSAFELKMYDIALSAYERILIANPDNLRSRLEAARTLFHLKSYKDAKKEFTAIAKMELPKNVRVNVERYRGLLEKLTQKKTLTGMFMAGLGYDSNANNGALQGTYFLPIIGDVLPGTKGKSDTAHQEVMMLNHVRKLGDSGKYALKNSLMVFAKTMTDQTDKNVVLTGWTPSLMYKNKNGSAELAMGYNTMWFGSDSYLSTWMLNPKFNIKIDKTLGFSLQYKWQHKKNEIQSNRERDSDVKGVRIGLKKKLTNGFGLSALYGYDMERKIRGARTDVDQNVRSLALGATKAWDKSLSFNLGFNYRNPRYIAVDKSFFTQRADKNYAYSVGFTKKLEKTWILNAKYSRVRNLSNQGPFSYEKDLVGLNIIKLFI
ncbi:MAG: porin family protein [Methylococcales bacterium]